MQSVEINPVDSVVLSLNNFLNQILIILSPKKCGNQPITKSCLFIFYNSQLEQAEIAFKTDDQEIEEVRKEFTVRVSTTEKKFQAAAKVCLHFCAK